MRYKPSGYTSVAPYLIVSGAAATIAFLQSAFDAEIVQVIDGPEGRIRHAEVRIDDTILMLTDAVPDWPAVPCHVHIYLPDVESAFQRALGAGGTAVQEPVQKDDDDRRGGVSDPGGTTWWIATKIS